MVLSAKTLVVNGWVACNGGTAGNGCSPDAGAGGGGAGGSVFLVSETMTLGNDSISATGSLGGVEGWWCGGSRAGTGGNGRIRLDYGTLNGVAFENTAAQQACCAPDAGHAESVP